MLGLIRAAASTPFWFSKTWQLSLLCISAVSVGCGSGFDVNSEVQKMNSNNAQRLANLYQHYQRKHQGIGPKDESKFKSFISEVNPVLLERIGVSAGSIDQLFTSERDGQPFFVRYGLKGNDRGPAVPTVFEEEGVDGKRLVACTQMVTKEVENDSEYQDLLKSKGLPVEM